MKPLRNLLRNPDCKDCNLYLTAQSVCLIGDGPWPCDIMLIGEAPGHREDDINKPFAGRAGRVLDYLLDKVGLSREKVFITNVVHCRPPNNRTPRISEVRSCRKYLLREIDKVNPKTIILLGSSACQGFFNKPVNLSELRGRRLKYQGRSIIATYHPAASLYDSYYAEVTYKDLVRGLEKNKINRKEDYNPDCKFPPNLSTTKVSIDVETSSLNPFELGGRIRCIGVSAYPGHALSYRDPSIVRDILSSPKVLHIGHNIKFDLKWLKSFNHTISKPFWDTLVAFHLLDENYPDKSLNHLAKIFTELPTIKESERDRDVMTYVCRHVDATMRLYKRFSPLISKLGLDNLMKKEMDLLEVLTDVELRGAKISIIKLEYFSNKFGFRIREIEKKLNLKINLDSPKQLGEYLFQERKLPIIKNTPTGQPATDEATLKRLSIIADDPSLELILERRTLTKLKRTYLDGLRELIRSDGKVHPTFSQVKLFHKGEDFEESGTVSGRLSCYGPNLQNIPNPEKNEYGNDIRSLFISEFKNDGEIMVADYSQIELRVLAEYSRDSRLLNCFSGYNIDIHRRTASEVFNIPEDKVNSMQRKFAKQINFGIIYGISPEGLAARLGISSERARRLIGKWFNRFPKVLEWKSRETDKLIKNKYVTSIFNRYRRLPNASQTDSKGREAIRQGINSLIQGAASDITTLTMIGLYKSLKNISRYSGIIANVHDSVVLDCLKSEVKRISRVVYAEFKEPLIEKYFGFKLKVPLEVHISSGPSWGKQTKIR